jgi:LPS O-antigen subunit length determinant protein (WzzB/FepE family)
MSNTQEQYQDDEIDLRELLISLWKNKILIITITAIFSITGIIYALLAPQVWSAKAIVVAPLPSQLEQLHLRLEKLVALLDITSKNLNTTSSIRIIDNQKITDNEFFTSDHDEFLAIFSEEKLYTDFIQAFDSFDNKSEFLKANNYVQPEENKDVNSLQRALEKMANNISVRQKKNEPAATLSFSADNAQEAGQLLNEYLNFVFNKELVAKNKVLDGKITSKIDMFNLVFQVRKAEALKRLQEEIERTEFALRISQTAGIEAPITNLNNNSIFAIDFGARALDEKLKILKEIKTPELINPELADIRLHLDSLLAMPQEKVSFVPYHFIRSPSEPLNRDKPKRTLMVVMATFAGLMMGTIVALFRASSFFSGGSKRD